MNQIIALVGTSGSGKSTIGEKIGIPEIKSTTTRKIRPNEKGDEYIFTNKFKFIWNKFTNKFIEFVKYSGNYYGIEKQEVVKKVVSGDCYVIVDRHGADQLKKIFPDQVTIIYISVTPETAKKRMEQRGDSQDRINERIYYSKIAGEFDVPENADYVISNESYDVWKAIDEIKEIIKPTIFIDVDGVVFNSMKRLVDMYNFEYNENVDWKQVNEWDVPQCDFVRENEILEFFENPYFYNLNYIDLIDNVENFVKDIPKEKYKVRFLTIGTVENNVNKIRSLKKLFPKVPAICINTEYPIMNKGFIKMYNKDWLIDDHSSNLRSCSAGNKILFQPFHEMKWNKDYKGTRCDSFKKIMLDFLLYS